MTPKYHLLSPSIPYHPDSVAVKENRSIGEEDTLFSILILMVMALIDNDMDDAVEKKKMWRVIIQSRTRHRLPARSLPGQLAHSPNGLVNGYAGQDLGRSST